MILTLVTVNHTESFGKKQVDTRLLQRVFVYANDLSLQGIPDSILSNIYLKCRTHIDRKNPLLYAIPTMYDIARDHRRDFLNESFSSVIFFTKGGDKRTQIKTLLMHSTVYHSRKLLPVIFEYLQPTLYDVTLFKGIILSPLVKSNKRFYHYRSIKYGLNQTRFFIRPKITNTQLIKGWIIVDNNTGRVDHFFFEGEYDMIHFVLQGEMGKDGIKSLLPKRCNIITKICTLGNRLHSWVTLVYDLNCKIPTPANTSESLALLDSIRPLPLTEEEKKILDADDSLKNAKAGPADSLSQVIPSEHRDSTELTDSVVQKSGQTDSSLEAGKAIGGIAGKIQKEPLKKKNDDSISIIKSDKQEKANRTSFWNIIRKNMLTHINTDIGDKKQGHIKTDPIFNPFYFGYTRRKGVVYRFDVKGYYNFTPNKDLSTHIKMGYSFKWKRFLYDIPITFNYNKNRNGWVKVEYFNGNRITNSNILDEIKGQKPDSIDWKKMNLDYFNDLGLKISTSYQVIKHHLDIQGGLIWHKRTAVEKEGFIQAGKPTSYCSSAPFLQVQYTPFNQYGPVINASYERGIKGFGGGEINYEKWEVDGQEIYSMPCMRSFSLRLGTGLYTDKSKGSYFLDYSNFREDYIPGGWNDEWSGEFELLNSNWYNASKFYVRANATYESPMLLLSWIPFAGQVVEKERIYVSALSIQKITPYVEVGYGFTNRLFSMGIFCGCSHHHFEGFGVKWGFELFNNW